MTNNIIDTNVLVVANGRSEQASLECEMHSINRLERIIATKDEIVLLDENREIMDEYQKHCHYSGQPGVGDMFFKFLYNHEYGTQKCRIINIKQSDGGEYVDFPQDSNLANFDRSDRKFVALSRACQCDAVIINSVDSDWLEFSDALRRNGIIIDNLCNQTGIAKSR